MKIIKRRNKAMTMERILQAMSDVMAERGTQKAGINAVAERAGINKVLIYRYFGGWDGLLEAYVQRGYFLSIFNSKFLDAIPGQLTPQERSALWADYISQLMRELRTRKSAQELLQWEMTNGSEAVVQQIVAFRNESFRKVIEKLAPFPGYDPSAISALIIAAITHLVMISNYHAEYIDVNLHTDEGWARLENALKRIFAGLVVQ